MKCKSCCRVQGVRLRRTRCDELCSKWRVLGLAIVCYHFGRGWCDVRRHCRNDRNKLVSLLKCVYGKLEKTHSSSDALNRGSFTSSTKCWVGLCNFAGKSASRPLWKLCIATETFDILTPYASHGCLHFLFRFKICWKALGYEVKSPVQEENDNIVGRHKRGYVTFSSKIEGCNMWWCLTDENSIRVWLWPLNTWVLFPCRVVSIAK